MQASRKPRAAMATLALLLCAAAAMGAALELPFDLNAARGAILIRGSVNGKPAQFLLDTGASRTVLGAEIMGVHPMDLKLAKFAAEGPGLHGEAMWSTASLQLSRKRWEERTVAVMNLQPLSKIYGLRIDGILGHDLLAEFSRVTIDFKRKTILLEE